MNFSASGEDSSVCAHRQTPPGESTTGNIAGVLPGVSTNRWEYALKTVNLGDKVRYLGIKGRVCAVSAADRTLVVAYDPKPQRHSPWISWDAVEFLERPVEADDSAA